MFKMEEDNNEVYENSQDEMIECTVENDEDLNNLTHGSDSLLIELVEGYPHIYDNRNPDFKDALKKEEAWNEIATAMEWPVSECQNRWLRLREKFARETRTMELENSLGLAPKKRTSFAFYEKMSFLKNHVKRRRTYPKVVTVPQDLKRSNTVQVHVSAVSSSNLHPRATISPTIPAKSPTLALPSKPVTSSNQPAIVQIHQPALVQIIKPVKVSTTEETISRSARMSSDTSRVGGVVITQSTSDTDDSYVYMNGESSAQKAASADALFGQFVAAELMKMPEQHRKLIKQKIIQILYE